MASGTARSSSPSGEHDRYFQMEKNDGYWNAKNIKLNTVITARSSAPRPT